MPQLPDINFNELFIKFRIPLLILLSGLILIACGVIYFKSGLSSPTTKIEVLNATTSGQVAGGEITVEIAGEILKPGVYKLANGSRIDDLLIVSGGFSKNADRVWTDKYLNRAAKLTDGQKIYIPKVSELAPYQDQQSSMRGAKTTPGSQTVSSTFSSDSNTLININTASLQTLDTLPGIGQTYGQNIIEHRPYSTIEELVSRGAIKQSLFDKIKNQITIY